MEVTSNNGFARWVKRQSQENVAEREREEQAKRAKEKWLADTKVIVLVLHEILNNLRSARPGLDSGLELTLQNEPPGVGIVASAKIVGQVVGKPVAIALTVDTDGLLVVSTLGPNVGYLELQFLAPHEINIETATKADYETLILSTLQALP